MPTCISLFSGCSGSDSGFYKAGFDIKFSVETNDAACRTYEANFGHRPLDIPVERLLKESFDPVDIVIGGPPCQSFSSARGGRQDRASGSGISNILNFLDFVAKVKPRLFIMENVPTLVRDIGFLPALTEINQKIKSIGYCSNNRVLSTEDYGIPQQRERLFFLGYRANARMFNVPKTRGWRSMYSGWAEYLDLPPLGLLIRRGSAMKGKTPFEAAYTVNGTDLMCIRHERSVSCGTFGAKLSGSVSANERLASGINQTPLTAGQLARLQGFDHDYKFCGDSKEVLKQIGNAWSVNVAYALALEAKEYIRTC